MDSAGNFLKQGRGDLFVGWILGEVDGYEDFLGFGIDIANINTTLVCEEDPVTLRA